MIAASLLLVILLPKCTARTDWLTVSCQGWNDDYIDLIRDDPSRTMMGSRQENWFYRSLSESKDRGAAWRIVGNQLIFSRVFQDDEGSLSGDNWSVSKTCLAD